LSREGTAIPLLELGVVSILRFHLLWPCLENTNSLVVHFAARVESRFARFHRRNALIESGCVVEINRIRAVVWAHRIIRNHVRFGVIPRWAFQIASFGFFYHGRYDTVDGFGMQ
jgi:hypothetical protein